VKTFISSLCLASVTVLFGLFANDAGAAGLTSGHYVFRVPYSPVFLNGTYPVRINEVGGDTLTVRTDAVGNLTGSLNIQTYKAPATGHMSLVNNHLYFYLEAANPQHRVRIRTTLDGPRISGTATTDTGTSECDLDPIGVEPLVVTFDLNIAVNNSGIVTGTGTANGGGVQVPVTVTGGNSPTKSLLRVTGVNLPTFIWQGSGSPASAGFTAVWTAHGFGVTRAGHNLSISPQNPPTSSCSILLANWISMSGSASVDSFDSSNPAKSTNALYDPAKRQSHGNICINNSSGSDLRNTFVYGDIQFTGPPIKNTKNVKGAISSPSNMPIVGAFDPFWAPGTFTQYAGGGAPPAGTFVATGSSTAPTMIKVVGDLTVPGGKSLNIASGGAGDKYINIWVTGKFTTSGPGMISQDPNVHVTWIVDSDITTSGGSYNNKSGRAANAVFTCVGKGKATVSGNASFIGVINGPSRDVTISGSGALAGRITANTLTISGGGGVHGDEAIH
jgi:hypothetical protein